jgi:hypothetical protein
VKIKLFKLILLLLLIMGCSQINSIVSFENKQNDYLLNVTTKKLSYGEDEKITFHASIKNIGEYKVTIVHGKPLIHVVIKDSNGNTIYGDETLFRQVAISKELHKSESYSYDSNFEFNLSPDVYKIIFTAFLRDDSGKEYEIPLSIDIEVADK